MVCTRLVPTYLVVIIQSQSQNTLFNDDLFNLLNDVLRYGYILL
jgi:hypothetical protein